MKNWDRVLKGIISVILSFAILFGGIVFSGEMVEIYAPDGRCVSVPKETLADYLSVGWYRTYEETVRTIYSMDGRRATVYLDQVPDFLSAGWYETYEDTVQRLYALDGRQIVVYKPEVPSYLKLGWYASIEETIQALYAPENKTITVYKSEVPSYLACGWTTYENAGMIALTFDDGPHGTYTNSILNTLETYGAKATFFTLGMQVNTYPSVVKRAKAMGCEIGSHTYSHADLTASSFGKIQKEINTARETIASAVHCVPTLFRPPYGNYNSAVRTTAGLPVILWNVDTRDWESRNAESIVRHVLANASDGNIILMHDIYSSTAEAVKILVPALIKRGFRLVTVSEMAKEKGIQLTNGMVYRGL